MSESKKEYLLRKKQESLNIIEKSTNDKKYYSAERQLGFVEKELKKI